MTGGHGHVTPRPDGALAKCGGPAICHACQLELEAKQAEEHSAYFADLIARYYRREIGRLMQQAEHWAANGAPLAVHHRVTLADAYFQIVALMERDQNQGWPSPFQTMRDDLSRDDIKAPGAYPPSAKIHRFRDPAFVVARLAGEDWTFDEGEVRS